MPGQSAVQKYGVIIASKNIALSRKKLAYFQSLFYDEETCSLLFFGSIYYMTMKYNVVKNIPHSVNLLYATSRFPFKLIAQTTQMATIEFKNKILKHLITFLFLIRPIS